MDLETLSIQLSKDPESYADEYKKVLLAYASIVDVPVQNAARVKQFLDILSPYIFKIETDFPLIVVRHLQTTTDGHIRDELVRLVIFFYNKHLIEPTLFFHLYLKYSNKLEIDAVTCYCGTKCLNVFFGYLENGNDKQKCFSFLMIVYIYEIFDFKKKYSKKREELHSFEISTETYPEFKCFDKISECLISKCVETIQNHLFTVPKLIKIAVLYFLNEIDFCVSENSKIVQRIGFVTAERLCRKLISSIRARSDLRDVRILKYKVITLLKRYYGLDIQVGSHLLRLIDPTKSDLKEVLNILIDTVDENEVQSVVDKILDTFCCEHKDDEFIVYGLNVLREFVVKFDMGDYVLDKINFKLGKSKSVFYAQNILIKTIKKKEVINMDVSYIKKKATKEEKLKSVMEGRGEVYFRRKALKKRKTNRYPLKKEITSRRRRK